MNASSLKHLLRLASFLSFCVFALPSAGFSQSIACGQTIGFDSTPPANWTVNTPTTGGAHWTNLAGCGEAGNYTGGSGNAACASSDYDAGAYDTQLISGNFYITAAPITLNFKANYQDNGPNDTFDVDISTNSGNTWQNILRWTSDQGSDRGTGVNVSLSLAAWAGSTAKIRFRYYNTTAGAWDWYAQVDDVRLECATSDRAITLESSTPVSSEGQLLNYSVRVTNNGPHNSSSVKVYDYLSAALSFVSASVPGGTAVYDEALRRATLDFGPLSVGESKTASVQAIGEIQPYPELRVNSPSSIGGDYEAGEALFGPDLTESGTTGALVASVPTDACGALTNASSIYGKIAIIARGTCEFAAKVKRAQDAGAIGAIITNTSAGGDEVTPMGTGVDGHLVTIPSLFIGYSNGQSIRAQLSGGVDVTLRNIFPEAQDVPNNVQIVPAEFDPLSWNNTSTLGISLLRDRDGDGSPDTQDQCLTDSHKSTPGYCGCGLPDADADLDGVVDCRYTETFAARIAKVQSVLRALRISGSSIKNFKKQKAALNKALNDMKAYLTANSAAINVSGAGVNLQKLLKTATSKSKSTLKARSNSSLASARSAALKALNKLRKGLVL